MWQSDAAGCGVFMVEAWQGVLTSGINVAKLLGCGDVYKM